MLEVIFFSLSLDLSLRFPSAVLRNRDLVLHLHQKNNTFFSCGLAKVSVHVCNRVVYVPFLAEKHMADLNADVYSDV